MHSQQGIRLYKSCAFKHACAQAEGIELLIGQYSAGLVCWTHKGVYYVACTSAVVSGALLWVHYKFGNVPLGEDLLFIWRPSGLESDTDINVLPCYSSLNRDASRFARVCLVLATHGGIAA